MAVCIMALGLQELWRCLGLGTPVGLHGAKVWPIRDPAADVEQAEADRAEAGRVYQHLQMAQHGEQVCSIFHRSISACLS